MVTDEDLSCHSAILVKLLGRDKGFVCRDLENAVGGGVDDKIARFQMLLAVINENLSTRIGQVTEHTSARCLFECLDYLLGKSVRIGGRRLFGYDARHFPMADGRVLAV